MADTDMTCPFCGDRLVTHRFEELDGLEAELCPLCGGAWLQQGELAGVQRRHAAGLRRLAGQARRKRKQGE